VHSKTILNFLKMSSSSIQPAATFRCSIKDIHSNSRILILEGKHRSTTVAQLAAWLQNKSIWVKLVGRNQVVTGVCVESTADNSKSYCGFKDIIDDCTFADEILTIEWGPDPVIERQRIAAERAELDRRLEAARQQQRLHQKKRQQEEQQQRQAEAEKRQQQAKALEKRKQQEERKLQLEQLRNQPPPPLPQHIQQHVPTFTVYRSDAFTADDQLMMWWFFWLFGTHFMRCRGVTFKDRQRFIDREGRAVYDDRQLYKTTLLLIVDMLSVKRENLDAVSVRLKRLLNDKNVNTLFQTGTRRSNSDLDIFCQNVPSRNKIDDLKSRVKKIMSKIVEQQDEVDVVETSGTRRQRE
jgi:hypothetical protein